MYNMKNNLLGLGAVIISLYVSSIGKEPREEKGAVKPARCSYINHADVMPFAVCLSGSDDFA